MSTSGPNNLISSAHREDIEAVRRLLTEGVDPDTVSGQWGVGDWRERTPLMEAAAEGRVDVMNVFMEHGADIERKDRTDDTALSLATKEGQAESVALLLGAGAATDYAGASGRTLLMHAVESGSVATTQILVDAGVDLHAKDDEGNTALHRAANEDNSDMTRLLLAAGADHTLVNRYGETPEQLTKGETLSVLVAHRERQALREVSGLTNDQEPVQRTRRM